MKNDTIIWQLILQLCLIGLNAIFACAEIAIISVNDKKLAKLAVQGDKRATKLIKLTDQPARFLATIQVAITLSGFLGSAFAADNFSDSLVEFLIRIGVKMSRSTLETIAVIFITLVLSYFTLIFGELVPKRIAMKKTESLALGLSNLIAVISKLFAPIVWFLTVSTNGVLKLLEIDPNSEQNEVTEEDIRMMAEAGQEKGTIPSEANNIIQNIFEFNDLVVEDIITRRADVCLLWYEDSIERWEEIIQESHHSLYPICEESMDNVIGVLDVKNYYRIKDKTKENVMKEAVRMPYFVPELVRADILFKNMKKEKNHFGIVLDEYGGMSGIITINDLLEELVGDFNDDGVKEDKVECVGSNVWRVNGGIALDELAKELNVLFPKGEYDTFGGYIMNELGYVPRDGSKCEVITKNLVIQVEQVNNHRIEEAFVRVKTNL